MYYIVAMHVNGCVLSPPQLSVTYAGPRIALCTRMYTVIKQIVYSKLILSWEKIYGVFVDEKERVLFNISICITSLKGCR